MKEIPLTQGFKAIVDDGDFALASQINWYAHGAFKGEHVYAYTHRNRNGKRRFFSLQNFILRIPVGTEIDHINHDTLDCRRSNLRVCSHRENSLNRRLFTSNKSGFRGVHKHKSANRWVAELRVYERSFYLGLFKDKIDAAIAYDMAALMFNGEFAQTNVLHPIT